MRYLDSFQLVYREFKHKYFFNYFRYFLSPNKLLWFGISMFLWSVAPNNFSNGEKTCSICKFFSVWNFFSFFLHKKTKKSSLLFVYFQIDFCMQATRAVKIKFDIDIINQVVQLDFSKIKCKSRGGVVRTSFQTEWFLRSSTLKQFKFINIIGI